eukprot:TRINITY_DN16964_c0_g1_i1.p1 TRINITY_DN16964_c0_g1~~TRINITY_DN16964_c0_g1_i1.p1  ORF type:complete len:654 (+),score=171.62 TRINITY_DN16964_c0_g1_i1:189-2150(+)
MKARVYLLLSVALLVVAASVPSPAGAVEVHGRNGWGDGDYWHPAKIWDRTVKYFSGDDSEPTPTATPNPARPVMTAADKKVAADMDSKIQAWVKQQKATRAIQMTFDLSIPVHVPRCKVSISATSVVEKGKTANNPGVNFAGEVSIGVTLDVAVELRIALLGFVEVKCPTCTTLVEVMQMLAFVVLRDYAEDEIQSLMMQDKEVSDNTEKMFTALWRGAAFTRLEQAAKHSKAEFAHSLRQWAQKLEISASMIFHDVISKPGSGLSTEGQQALAKAEEEAAIYLEDYQVMLHRAYVNLLKAYEGIGVAKYNARTRHELKILAKKQAYNLRGPWANLVQKVKELSRGLAPPAHVLKLKQEFIDFATKYAQELQNGGLPRGYTALQDKIGYDARAAFHTAFKSRAGIMAQARKKFESKSIELKAALGLSVSASAEWKKKEWDFNAEVRGVIGRDGTAFPFKPESNKLTTFKSIAGGISVDTGDVGIDMMSELTWKDKDVRWETVLVVQHNAVMEKALPKDLKAWLSGRAKKIVDWVKGAMKLQPRAPTSAGTAIIKRIFSQAGVFFKKAASEPDGFFASNGVRLQSGPFFEIKVALACPNTGNCAWKTPQVKVGWAGADLLNGIGTLLNKVDAIANSPIDFDMSKRGFWVWEVQF